MSTARRFLLAPSLARLIERERGGYRITEGYFPARGDQSLHVRLEEGAGTLVLLGGEAGGSQEKAADLPSAQAWALVDLTAGRVDYLRIELGIGTGQAQILRYHAPGPLDLVTVPFETEEQAQEFATPPWFGPEVTADRRYRREAIARNGLPETPEVELTNAALSGLLDTLERWSPSHGRRETDLVTPRAEGQPQRAISAAEPLHMVEPGQSDEDSGIEDEAIRELAIALRPQRR